MLETRGHCQKGVASLSTLLERFPFTFCNISKFGEGQKFFNQDTQGSWIHDPSHRFVRINSINVFVENVVFGIPGRTEPFVMRDRNGQLSRKIEEIEYNVMVWPPACPELDHDDLEI